MNTPETDKIYRPETGVVISIDEDGCATISLSRTKACEFCGQCSVSKEDGMMTLKAETNPEDSLKPGDHVAVIKKPAAQIKAMLLLLLSPLLGLVLGLFLGFFIFPQQETKQALFSIAGAILAVFISFVIIRIKKWHKGAGLTITKLTVLILSSVLFLSSCKVERVRVTDSKPQSFSVGLKTSDDDFFPSDAKFLESTETSRLYASIPDSIFKRMEGKSFPKDCQVKKEDLRYVRVKHYGFDGQVHAGEFVVDKAVAPWLVSIFKQLFEQKYQIERIKLIDDFDADDNFSMKNNNSSAFCYRTIAGKDKLSKHALGLAIDINPLYNPCVTYNKDGSIKKVEPEEGRPYIERDPSDPRRITKDSEIYKIFTENGFIWGGDWGNPKDYQHFEFKANE